MEATQAQLLSLLDGKKQFTIPIYHRWYLLAKDHKDKKTKTFGLDRLSDLQITTTKFVTPSTFSVLSKACPKNNRVLPRQK